MNKKQIIPVAVVLVFAMGVAANAQQSSRLAVIGCLDEGSISRRSHLWEALRRSLAEAGHIENQNVTFECRGGDGDSERLAHAAAELVRLNAAVIVTGGIRAAVVARKATRAIPIVMASGTDPVGVGLIASFSRPQGNVTGITTECAGKSG